MPVLKAPKFNPARKDAVVLDLGDLGRQAAKLRALAEQQAEGILAEARDEAAKLSVGAEETGKKQGYEAGLAQGIEEGRTQGREAALEEHREQIATLIQQWNAALGDFEGTRATLDREARTAVLRLAVRLAEKVVHRHVAIHPDAVLDQVREALSLILEPTRATLRVHPEDHALLSSLLPEVVAEFDAVEHAEAVADPGIAQGGCVLTYGPGRIDATIEMQLSRLASLLLDPAPESTSEPDTPNQPQATTHSVAETTSEADTPEPDHPGPDECEPGEPPNQG